MAHESPRSLSDTDLLATVQRLTARSNVALADLLLHLGEVEARGIHRTRACASLYTYCIYELRMSEDAAFRRSKAARLVHQYPELRDVVARGEIHLTGLLMIGPHLGGERHAEILERARFRTKREILRLIARIDPKPEVPPLVEPIGPAPARRATYATFAESLAGPVRELPPGERPGDWIEPDVDEPSESESGDGARARRGTRARCGTRASERVRAAAPIQGAVHGESGVRGPRERGTRSHRTREASIEPA